MKRALSCLLIVLALVVPASADERGAARAFERARRDEPSLIAFLRSMPKGADLHSHVGGALYPEDTLQAAIRHGAFFNPRTGDFETENRPGNVPAARLLTDDALRYQFFNNSSMRAPVSGPAGGHDHFFRTFRYGGAAYEGASRAEMLTPVVQRARLQNLQYMELMATPGGAAMNRAREAAATEVGFEAMLAKVRPLLPEYVRAAKADLDAWDRDVAKALRIEPPLSAADRPITVRYLATAIRTAPEANILAAWACAFALMKEDPRLAGVNFAAPEDHPVARERFTHQMRLLDTLWKQFDHPNVTLHAGELNLFLAPIEDLTFHIHQSIELGHARRIGHGTAVAWEDDSPGLLRKMRDEGIAVEVCPTSAAVILGMEGDRHPFSLYRRAGVPLTINTDDEGVSRSNMTMEYVRAVRSWNLTYADVKELVRNGIEYSFLPGDSLFEGREYRKVRAPFRRVKDHGWVPDDEDRKALAASDRATVQARLERAWVEFEATY